MTSLRWEYLLTNEYKIRFAIAEYYLSKCNSVVDIGSYKYKINLPNKLYCIDPNSTIQDSYIGKVSGWWNDVGQYLENFGMCFLGCDIHEEEELRVIYKMREVASTIVVESSKEHAIGTKILDNFLQWKEPHSIIELTLPSVITDNMLEYPTHNKRKFVIYD